MKAPRTVLGAAGSLHGESFLIIIDLKCEQKARPLRRRRAEEEALPASRPGRGWEGLILDLGS